MRIGMHTGTIIAGVIGRTIVRYDIYGKDVLIAKKMEQNGAPGYILMTDDSIVKLKRALGYNIKADQLMTIYIKELEKNITGHLIKN
mmetsp:Transcript_1849/g.214  ORF Transcript_1849/g.214 Transcript_1849/m.214 type:complete len:87 (+) Transcript_1849:181-441(+)